MMRLTALITMLVATLSLAGCGKSGGDGGANAGGAGGANAGGTHTHADGTVHSDSEHADDTTGGDHGHHDEHDETPLGTTTIGGMTVEAAQGHGNVEAGKLGHLVVKLPYNDNGASIVRAWIGTEDRDLYLVGRGDYAPSHDDYDIHAEAPDPLPDGAAWWIEIEKPDGTRVTGSIGMITEG